MTNDVREILSQPLFSVADDLAAAKKNGTQLPGLLDHVAEVAIDAKIKGVDLAYEDMKHQFSKHIAWIVACVLALTLLAFLIRYKVVKI